MATSCMIDLKHIHTKRSKVVVFKKNGDRVGTNGAYTEKGVNHDSANPSVIFGSPARTRTTDPMVNSHLLYRLSYWGKSVSEGFHNTRNKDCQQKS